MSLRSRNCLAEQNKIRYKTWQKIFKNVQGIIQYKSFIMCNPALNVANNLDLQPMERVEEAMLKCDQMVERHRLNKEQ